MVSDNIYKAFEGKYRKELLEQLLLRRVYFLVKDYINISIEDIYIEVIYRKNVNRLELSVIGNILYPRGIIDNINVNLDQMIIDEIFSFLKKELKVKRHITHIIFNNNSWQES